MRLRSNKQLLSKGQVEEHMELKKKKRAADGMEREKAGKGWKSRVCPLVMRMAKREAKKAAEYLRQTAESGGFDLDDDVVPDYTNTFLSYRPITPCHIKAFDLSMPKFCKAAVETYNREHNLIHDSNKKFKFKKFAYGTYTIAALCTYYLTFHATTNSGTNHIFEACVVNHKEYYKGSPNIPEVESCQIKDPPKVCDVQIVGDLVEGNTVRGTGHYIGGREGESKFEWLRRNIKTGATESLLSGKTEYTLRREDVGHCLVFGYSPVNSEGQEGECRVFQTSKKVKASS